MPNNRPGWVRRVAALVALAMVASLTALASPAAAGDKPTEDYFERAGTFLVYDNLADGEDPATETSAEIVAASPDGMTLIYSDSPAGRIGFVDISDPSNPAPAGFVSLPDGHE
ncbi:MAG: hypothetical protein AAFN30_16575, partial [Actinomycetota bacterium]